MLKTTDARGLALRWGALVALSIAFVAIFELMRLPAALLLGPMLAGILFATGGVAMHVPKLPTLVAQCLVGCMIARPIPMSIAAEVARDWPIFLVGVSSVLLAATLLGWLLAKLRILPGTTAIWGSMPGGASAMVIMSEAYGADMRLVAFMQYLRIVCVAVAATAISSIWVDVPTHSLAATDWFPPVRWLPFAETLLLIAASILISRRVKIPAGVILLPMIGGIVLQTTGILRIELPPWLMAAGFAVLGWSIGVRFSREIIAHALRALPQVFGAIIALIAVCFGFALILADIADVDLLTAYLATSPGGVDSVAIIALSSDVDVAFVMAMQMARLLVLLLAGPLLARMIVHWAHLGPDKVGDDVAVGRQERDDALTD
jgi:membrane AbrB-like protein